MRAVGGEIAATSALAPKIGPLGLAPKKVGDDIAKATKDWKGIGVTVKLTIQNRYVELYSQFSLTGYAVKPPSTLSLLLLLWSSKLSRNPHETARKRRTSNTAATSLTTMSTMLPRQCVLAPWLVKWLAQSKRFLELVNLLVAPSTDATHMTSSRTLTMVRSSLPISKLNLS